MVSKAEDYSAKLHTKIEDDKEILRANKGIFKSWQSAVQKNAENFEGQIENLSPTGEGYKRAKHHRKKKAPKKRGGFFSNLIG
jgi:hypothetical protein